MMSAANPAFDFDMIDRFSKFISESVGAAAALESFAAQLPPRVRAATAHHRVACDDIISCVCRRRSYVLRAANCRASFLSKQFDEAAEAAVASADILQACTDVTGASTCSGLSLLLPVSLALRMLDSQQPQLLHDWRPVAPRHQIVMTAPPVSSLAPLARTLRHHAVSLQNSCVTGDALHGFIPGDTPEAAQHNTLSLTVLDMAGSLADAITLQDIQFTVNFSDGCNFPDASVTCTLVQSADGVFRLSFRVLSSATRRVFAHVCITGVPLPHSPFILHHTYLGGSILLRDITVEPVETSKYGLAVNPSETLLAVTSCVNNQLALFALPSNERLTTFSRAHSMDFPTKVRFRSDDRLLVVNEGGTCALVELSTSGQLLRQTSIPLISCIDVNEAIIVIGRKRPAPEIPCVQVRDVGTHELLCAFDGVAGSCEEICLTCDGMHVLVAGFEDTWLSMYTLTGAYVRRIGFGVLGGKHVGIACTPGGRIVVADFMNHRVCLFDMSSERSSSWGSRRDADPSLQLHEPTALAVASTHLYVLQRSRVIVKVFQ